MNDEEMEVDVEGLSNEEIPGILGLSVHVLNSGLDRARLFLMDKLSDISIN